MNILETQALAKNFGGLQAVGGIDLVLEEGERRAIIGPNGAGKTTLFHLISGFLAPSSGRIRAFGRDVTELQAHQRAAQGIVRTFQVTNLFPKLTVFENLLLAVQATHPARFCFYRTVSRVSGIIEQTEQLLREWNLWDRRALPVRELSYGEQRQTEVVMALATKPRMLLLDEPTAGLSRAESTKVVTSIKNLPRDISTLLIEHDMDVAFEIADTVTVLHVGRVVADGLASEVRRDPRVREIYLG